MNKDEFKKKIIDSIEEFHLRPFDPKVDQREFDLILKGATMMKEVAAEVADKWTEAADVDLEYGPGVPIRRIGE